MKKGIALCFLVCVCIGTIIFLIMVPAQIDRDHPFAIIGVSMLAALVLAVTVMVVSFVFMRPAQPNPVFTRNYVILMVVGIALSAAIILAIFGTVLGLLL